MKKYEYYKKYEEQIREKSQHPCPERAEHFDSSVVLLTQSMQK